MHTKVRAIDKGYKARDESEGHRSGENMGTCKTQYRNYPRENGKLMEDDMFPYNNFYKQEDMDKHFPCSITYGVETVYLNCWMHRVFSETKNKL